LDSVIVYVLGCGELSIPARRLFSGVIIDWNCATAWLSPSIALQVISKHGVHISALELGFAFP
jgi:hypothetical protein